MRRCIFVLFNIFFLLISCEEKRAQIDKTSLNKEDNEQKQAIAESNEIMYADSPSPSASDFEKYIVLSNCTPTDAYSVPSINCHIFGLLEDPPNPIEENHIGWIFDGIQICLENSISPENDFTLIMKNDKYEFSRKINLFPIHNENGISGYYDNIELEIKPWIIANEDNKWRLIVTDGQNELINESRELSYRGSFLFDTIDDSPFVINSLKYVELNKQYTYRFLNELADILILYHSPDYGVYKPILYLIPNKNNMKSYTDIEISWNDEIVKGVYYIEKYKLDDLPAGNMQAEETTAAVFDFIDVR
jgi:hypothetical protein